MGDGVRLQKRLARLGVASRRQSERLIEAGRISVNGKVVTELGTRVQAGDTLALDGETITAPSETVVLVLNKPTGTMCTRSDERDRATVYDLLDPTLPFLAHVGRLDYNTEGALLFTNDGDLTHGLLHPDSAVPRTYEAKVRGHLGRASLRRLEAGVPLDGRPTRPIGLERLPTDHTKHDRLLLTLTEGRNRHVRRILESVGHPVIKLRRISFGPIGIDGLPRGRWRWLNASEVRELRSLTRG